MPFVLDKQEQWSKVGLRITVISVAAAVVFSLADGVLRGLLRDALIRASDVSSWRVDMLDAWCTDFRYLAEQLTFVGALIFVAGKFIETRSIFTVGFDRMDAAKVSMKGPDDDNIVWIGHRYGTRMEAETVASAIESRLKESAE